MLTIYSASVWPRASRALRLWVIAVAMCASAAFHSGAAAQEPTDSLRAEVGAPRRPGRQFESRGGPPERGRPGARGRRRPRPFARRGGKTAAAAGGQPTTQPREPRTRSSSADSAPCRPSTPKSASTPISSGISTRTTAERQQLLSKGVRGLPHIQSRPFLPGQGLPFAPRGRRRNRSVRGRRTRPCGRSGWRRVLGRGGIRRVGRASRRTGPQAGEVLPTVRSDESLACARPAVPDSFPSLISPSLAKSRWRKREFPSTGLPRSADWAGTYEATVEVTRSSNETLFGEAGDLSLLGHLNGFWNLSPSTDVDLGLSWIRGTYMDDHNAGDRDLYGAEGAFTWRPPGQSRYRGFTLRGGVMALNGLIHEEEHEDEEEEEEEEEVRALEDERAMGWWGAGELRLSQSWLVGGRFGRVEHPRGYPARRHGSCRLRSRGGRASLSDCASSMTCSAAASVPTTRAAFSCR